MSKHLTPLQHHIQSSYDSTDCTLTENPWHLYTEGSRVSNSHTENVTATVTCEKPTLRKIHPNPRYPHRRLSLAISSTTEALQIHQNRIQVPLPPFRQHVPSCRAGETRLLGTALCQPDTHLVTRSSTGFPRNGPTRSPHKIYRLHLPVNVTTSLTRDKRPLK